MSTAVVTWQELLKKSITDSMKVNKDSITYSLSTMDVARNQSRARFVVHRGFVNEHHNESLEGLKNSPKDGTSDAMVITTDSRSQKVEEITKNSNIELVWWFEPIGQQFRITGRAHLYFSSAQLSNNENFPANRLAPKSAKSFDWESERLRIWRKMSPALRASFLRPPPGQELTERDDPSSWLTELPSDLEAKTPEEKVKVVEAMTKFALVIVDPNHVDWVSLKEVPNRRVVHSLDKDGNWSSVEVVP